MATSSRDFLLAAAHRLTTAQFLLDHHYNLDAMYLAGYTVECALKALILDRTPPADRRSKLLMITRGKQMHYPETLGKLLADLGHPISKSVAARLRRFRWSTDFRYESGRKNTSEALGFLKTAKMVYDWVERQLP